MKEKIKKILLWLVLIFFAMALVGSALDIITSLKEPRGIVISLIIFSISWLVVVKVKQKLTVPDLLRKNKVKD